MTTSSSAKTRVTYDCRKCPAYCCSIYERVEVKQRDLRRLARYFGVSLEVAARRYTKHYLKERVLRRRTDPVLGGRACMFLDPETRGCTIYHARPEVCRDYPGRTRCSYYDLLQFERMTQGEPDVVPLIQITFRAKKRAGADGT